MDRWCPAEKSVEECQIVWIETYKVESRVLGLEKRKQSSTSKRLAIKRWREVMWRVSGSRNISDVDDLAEGVLEAEG